MSVRRRLTERRAALAARQLLYHREHLRWMEERMAENEEILESYLAIAGEERTILPGGCVLIRAEEAAGTPSLEVRKLGGESGFEQLGLDVG